MKTKVCTNCDQEKDLSEFYKNKLFKDGLTYWCKKCTKKYNGKFYKKNNKIIKKQRKQFREKFPEKRILSYIKDRCNNPNNKAYKYYGLRGIKNFLTEEDIIFLMKRDNYWKLEKPSIDREDNDGDYKLNNCRFIELGKNTAERNIRSSSKSVFRFDLNNNFIKRWASIREVERDLGINNGNISSCIKGKLKSSGGYKWRFTNEN